MKRANYLFLISLLLVCVSVIPQSNARETVFYEDQYKNLQVGVKNELQRIRFSGKF